MAIAAPTAQTELSRYFRISSRSHHGLVFVTELAKAYANGEPLSIRSVAQRAHISEGYLEELAARLRDVGIIRGTRGRGGGYTLAKSPNAVTMGEVIRLLDGPVIFAACQDSRVVRGCPTTQHCASRRFFGRLKRVIDAELDASTLADFV